MARSTFAATLAYQNGSRAAEKRRRNKYSSCYLNSIHLDDSEMDASVEAEFPCGTRNASFRSKIRRLPPRQEFRRRWLNVQRNLKCLSS